MANNITSNVSQVAGTNTFSQDFGLDVSGVNSGELLYYGTEDIILIDVSGEGVISGEFAAGHPYAGTTGFKTTRSVVKTFDLISEGEIEGLVSGDFKYSGDAEEGQIGFESGSIVPYTQNPEAFLRSVYLNDTPIVNSNNLYNFQSAQLAFSNGSPSGIVTGDNFLNITDENPLEKTRVINERLRGPDRNDSDENPFYYHKKVYRFLNNELNRLKVHIKIPSLTYTKVGGPHLERVEGENGGAAKWVTSEYPVEELGQVRGSHITFNYRYRPVEKDALGNINYSQSRKWYGMGGTGGNSDEPFFSTVKGLIRSAYIHEKVITFDNDLKTKNVVGWEIEITRITLDSIESHIVNESYVESITEVYESTLSYPNSAIASMSFNAEYFSQIPNRSYDCRLLKVQVPDTYEPITRTYHNEPWGGDFKTEKAWTDNPAWVFYDLITNKRYGLGRFLGDLPVDRWTLYEISKFCDVLVSDGEGGFEPRFSCNVLINTREDAVKVVNDFASVFRSIVYYGYGNIYPAIDKPRDVIAQFTNANVEDGNFTYSSSSKKTLPTVCLVRYNDKQNFYKPAIEYVENTESIRKYGIVEKEVTAFACTSRSQAVRLGRWILSTESEQTETVTFTTGPEAMLLRPGDIVKLTDTNRSEVKYGGRATQANKTGIALDRTIDLKPDTDYSLTLTTPTYFYDPSIIDITSQTSFADFRRSHVQSFDFNTSTTSDLSITTGQLSDTDPNVSGVFISRPAGSEMFSDTDREITNNSVWSLGDINQKNTNLYSVITTKENDNLSYKVDALLHSTGKFTYIESGIYYSYVPSATGQASPPPLPTAIELSSTSHPESHTGFTKRMKITVKPCPQTPPSCDVGTTAGYKIYIKSGSRSWLPADLKSESSSVPKDHFYFETLYFSDYTESGEPVTFYLPPRNGEYAVRVFSINSLNIRSSTHKDGQSAGQDGIEISEHYPVRDVNIHGLRLASSYEFNEVPEEGVVHKEVFDYANSKNAIVQWDVNFLNESINSIPIAYKVSIHTANTNSSIPLTKLEEYETEFQIFDFTFDRNLALPNGVGPLRHFDLVVQAMDENGVTSSGVLGNGQQYGWDIVEITNPKPPGYYLTPRKNDGRQVAKQIVDDPVWTNQFIDSDGYVHIDFLANTYPDIAGGYCYISKHPFSGADFHSDGRPKSPMIDTTAAGGGSGVYRKNLVFSSGEVFKTGEYLISENHFTAPVGTTLNPYDSEITFKPDLTGSFNPPYYIAMKLYDDFDREIFDRGLNPYWNSGLINNTYESDTNTGLWLSFGRDTTGAGASFVSEPYCLTTGSCGEYIGSPDEGEPTAFHISSRPTTVPMGNSTFAIPIRPTKYYSANQGGFKYWIRLNINGQWEGQGISHIKILTQKDVLTTYKYKGFWEYSCTLTEKYEDRLYDGAWYRYFFPNHANSITRCRFRQTQLTSSLKPNANKIDHPLVYFWGGQTNNGYPYYATTGATRDFLNVSILPEELTRAGIAPDYDLHTSQPAASPNTDLDEIASYNERGELINKRSRPLRGFRRFRVYFDENNLPETANPSGLASYAVVGMNSWNGEYESWPADSIKNVPPNTSELTDSILFAKDGYHVFPSSVQSWLHKGDVFENIPGVWNHHPAGFGQGFGGLAKRQKYFDVHMGRMIDDSYLNEAFFGVVTTNDYAISDQIARLPIGYDPDSLTFGVHEAVYSKNAYVTLPQGLGGDGSGMWNDPNFV